MCACHAGRLEKLVSRFLAGCGKLDEDIFISFPDLGKPRQCERLRISVKISPIPSTLIQLKSGASGDNQHALKACLGRFHCIDVDLIFDVSFEDDTVFFRDLETCFGAGG